MSDYIKREDAIKVVNSYIGTDQIVEKLKDIPSAEPKKVCIGQIHFDDEKLHEIVNEAVKKLKEEIEPKQGEWIRDRYWSRGAGMGEEYGFFYKCSLCEYEVENGYTRCGFNFCPYCGASMKGADDED